MICYGVLTDLERNTIKASIKCRNSTFLFLRTDIDAKSCAQGTGERVSAELQHVHHTLGRLYVVLQLKCFN